MDTKGTRLSTDVLVRLFKNIVRGFSLVLSDPKGSHYRRQPAAKFFAEFTLSEVRFFAPKRRGSD